MDQCEILPLRLAVLTLPDFRVAVAESVHYADDESRSAGVQVTHDEHRC